ncbi:hypothetical protein RY831_04630 [Noviherbaspirillum sp. CPCC 100848]|uniref:Uncharacterized protein n=1 Tax=Noviherbaspirillum album TaxID=3080276 RepID=A0ABU6J456_9BURK|nr:hypothetical protein [Noviherbaspirillum sp. CPCC 100848]MEC4718419.1 hypothetical protein [Noviherbaspirillum sp. CPCC 100848]
MSESNIRRRKSIFSIPKMDCTSDGNLIRMALNDRDNVESLSFGLRNRELEALHRGETNEIISRLEPLKLGAVLRESMDLSSMDKTEHRESTFYIPKMDCPSEENLIRWHTATNLL